VSSLPPLYAGWIDALLAGEMPDEPRSTCDDCAMAPRPDDVPGERRFDPKLKCCTFYPELPNFTVGAILDDASSPGRAEVRRRFGQGVGVTPLGMSRPAVYEAVFTRSQGTDAFGRSAALRCGFLDSASRCGIWAHRESTCVTFFCKLGRGSRGSALWKALQDLLVAIERQLSQWCVVELDPGDEALALLFRPPAPQALGHKKLDGIPDPAELKALWGRWAGRELELYRESAARVRALSWSRVLEISGPEVAARARVLLAAHRRHQSEAIPERLQLGGHTVIAANTRRTRLRAYSPLDPIDLEPGLAAALVEFDGRPTAEAVAAVHARGVELDADRLRTLVDFDLLIPAKDLVRR
jgi:hypothetical protein